MFTRSSARGVAAHLVVASVALAACGSDDSSSEPVDTQPAAADITTTEPSTTEPVDTTDAEGAGRGAARSGIEPNTTPMSPEDSAVIDAAFQEIIDTAGDQVPGIWVGIWNAETGQYSAAYGKAELGGVDATIEGHRRIGSVTKTFTATAVIERVDGGELALEDTIADILPDLADARSSMRSRSRPA